MKKHLPLFAFLTCSFSPGLSQTFNLGTTTVTATSIYTSPQIPWELKYGPNDSLWMTTRPGQIWRISAVNGGATLLLDHTAIVEDPSEAGMLGFAFDPEFASNRYIYVVYNFYNGGTNLRERLSRFTYSGDALGNELVEIGGNSIAAFSIHNGSRLAFLPDNTLLMTTGDASNTSLAQNTTSLNGKVLRINRDGSIPANNPDPASYVYSRGHRNPQGLLVHPNGLIYSAEHGQDDNDELNIVEANRNYGWPNVRGYCDNDIGGTTEAAYCAANNIREPIASWNVVPGGTWAPADIYHYTSPVIPEFQNTILVSFLKTGKIRRVTLNAAGTAVTAQQDFFTGAWGRLRDVTGGTNGDLYILTNTAPFRIIRVRNESVVSIPSISPFSPAASANLPAVYISPNPAADYFQINQSGPVPARIRIFDDKGVLVREIRPTQNVTTVNISQWPAGLYYITGTEENGQRRFMKKLLKR